MHSGNPTKDGTHESPNAGVSKTLAATAGAGRARVTLYWIPLGAGGHVVRLCGRIYEAIRARAEHRQQRQLYHCALEVDLDSQRFTVEVGPAWGWGDEGDRGVVTTGPVGAPLLRRSRFFRYEVRRWLDGVIPDLAYAVGRPLVVGRDPQKAAQLLAALPGVPALTWGRDELSVGGMWNSNSVIAYVLGVSGHTVGAISPPRGGDAPGWRSGLAAADLLVGTDGAKHVEPRGSSRG